MRAGSVPALASMSRDRLFDHVFETGAIFVVCECRHDLALLKIASSVRDCSNCAIRLRVEPIGGRQIRNGGHGGGLSCGRSTGAGLRLFVEPFLDHRCAGNDFRRCGAGHRSPAASRSARRSAADCRGERVMVRPAAALRDGLTRPVAQLFQKNYTVSRRRHMRIDRASAAGRPRPTMERPAAFHATVMLAGQCQHATFQRRFAIGEFLREVGQPGVLLVQSSGLAGEFVR